MGNRAVYFQAVDDTLLRITPTGIEPYLASEYSYHADQTVLTLKIRSGVKFTDGTEITADIVKQNLDRFKSGGGSFASDGTEFRWTRRPRPPRNLWITGTTKFRLLAETRPSTFGPIRRASFLTSVGLASQCPAPRSPARFLAGGPD